MDHPFRSAAVGGFNRQDVLDYLEKTAAENAQKQQELEKQLEQQKQELEQLRRRAGGAGGHLQPGAGKHVPGAGADQGSASGHPAAGKDPE